MGNYVSVNYLAQPRKLTWIYLNICEIDIDNHPLSSAFSPSVMSFEFRMLKMIAIGVGKDSILRSVQTEKHIGSC